MLNNNALKTSLIFLSIIFLAILLRFFLVGDGVMEESSLGNRMADIFCSFDWFCK